MPLMIAGALGRATLNYLDESRKRRREDEAYNIATQDRTREAEEREGAQRLMMDLAPLATMPPEQRRQKAAELSGNVQTGKYKLSPQVAASVVAQLQSTVQGMEQADRETEKQRSEAAQRLAKERSGYFEKGYGEEDLDIDPVQNIISLKPGAQPRQPPLNPANRDLNVGGHLWDKHERKWIPTPEIGGRGANRRTPALDKPPSVTDILKIQESVEDRYMKRWGKFDSFGEFESWKTIDGRQPPHVEQGITADEYIANDVDDFLDRYAPSPEIGGTTRTKKRVVPPEPKPAPPAQEPWRYDVMGRGQGPIAPPAMPQIAAPAQVAPMQTPTIGQQPAVVTPQDTTVGFMGQPVAPAAQSIIAARDSAINAVNRGGAAVADVASAAWSGKFEPTGSSIAGEMELVRAVQKEPEKYVAAVMAQVQRGVPLETIMQSFSPQVRSILRPLIYGKPQ